MGVNGVEGGDDAFHNDLILIVGIAGQHDGAVMTEVFAHVFIFRFHAY